MVATGRRCGGMARDVAGFDPVAGDSDGGAAGVHAGLGRGHSGSIPPATPSGPVALRRLLRSGLDARAAGGAVGAVLETYPGAAYPRRPGDDHRSMARRHGTRSGASPVPSRPRRVRRGLRPDPVVVGVPHAGPVRKMVLASERGGPLRRRFVLLDVPDSPSHCPLAAGGGGRVGVALVFQARARLGGDGGNRVVHLRSCRAFDLDRPGVEWTSERAGAGALAPGATWTSKRCARFLPWD